MWFLIVLAVIFLIIIAVLLIRATVCVHYDGAFKTTIRILFFKKEISLTKLLDMLNKPKKEEEEKKEPEVKAEKKPKEKPAQKDGNFFTRLYAKEGVAGIFNLLSIVIEALGASIGKLVRTIKINKLFVNIVVAADDAAVTAESFGKLCQYYYPFLGILSTNMKLKKYEENISADYLATYGSQDIYVEVSFSLMTFLAVGVKLIKSFVSKYFRYKRFLKKAQAA